MSVAVPIAPRFFVLLLALAASLTLDLLFFFGARGSSASFTFFAFARGAGGGHEPPLTVSARIGRGRASAATVKAASSRARVRAMAPAATPRGAACSAWQSGVAGLQSRCDTSLRPQTKCAGSLHHLIAEIPLLGAYCSVQRPLRNLKCVEAGFLVSLRR